MQPATREAARHKKVRRYFTGRRCANGHDAERYTSNGSCVSCTAESADSRYRKSPETFVDRVARRRRSDPSITAKMNAQRRARKRASPGSHTPDDIKRIYRAQRGKCAYCRVTLKGKYDLDHIRPLSRGGSNRPNNLQVCCRRCNGSKRAKDPIDFARSIGLLI